MSDARIQCSTWLACLSLAGWSSAAVAADSTPPGAPVLGAIVVTGERLAEPALSAELNDQALARQAATTSDAASLLRDQPGVALQGAGGLSSLPVVRGIADDRNRIKVDGMDLIASCPNHMNPPLSYLSSGNVARLKVYAGITPVSVGGDSIGSTIIAETPDPRFAKEGDGTLVAGSLGLRYRDNGNAVGGEAAATFATESLSLDYAGGASDSDNYVAGDDFKTSTATGRVGHVIPLDEVGSTAYRARNHSLGVALRGEGRVVEAKLGYQDMPEQLYPNQRMDLLGNEQWRLNLRYLADTAWGAIEARAYREHVDHYMDFGPDKRFWYGTASGGNTAIDGTPCSPISATCAAGMPMYTKSTNTGVVVKADVATDDDGLVRVGTEYQCYRLDDWWPPSGGGMFPNTFINVNDGQRDRLAVFAEREQAAGTGWTLLYGARYEQVRSDAGPVAPYAAAANGQVDADRFNALDRKRTDSNVDLTALARWVANETRSVEVGFARKVRSPSLYERYTWRARGMEMLMVNWFGDGNGYIGNPDLDPEVAYSLSAAFDWHAADRAWEFKVTPHYTRVEDYIDAVRCPTVLGTSCTAGNLTATNSFVFLQFANQSAEIAGIDVSGRAPLVRGEMGSLSVEGVAAVSRGTNRDTGDNLYNQMPASATLKLVHGLDNWTSTVEAVGVAAKNKVSATRNEIPTAGYGLMNLRVAKAWRQLRLDFGVENVFDRLYAHPLGGAYLGQGTTMATAAASSPLWGTAVPGPGRTVYAGANYKF
jgi:iron complex outermembrane receptor protein